MSRITVIGLHTGNRAILSSALQQHIDAADLLVGGKRHLAQFPSFSGETLSITNNIEAVFERLEVALQNGERSVVLASGDPLFFGMGGTLRRRFKPEQLEIYPAPSSFQLAFAAMGEWWQDATLLSAHGRPLERVIAQIRQSKKAAILTDNRHTPAVIARELIENGVDPISRCAVCENMGQKNETVKELMLQDCVEAHFAPLNVMLVWPLLTDAYPTIGIPDHLYRTEKQQITKREVRLLTLAELELSPDQIMWDIGAGSGAVSIEAGRMAPGAMIYAVEKRAIFCNHIRSNLANIPAPNVQLHEGMAPLTCRDWPDPDAIFVGGSGGYLNEIIGMAKARLKAGGRLVLNMATLENLLIARQHLPDATVNQIQIGKGQPIQEMLRFEALNPVFMVKWRKS